jgi:hypothetical protein
MAIPVREVCGRIDELISYFYTKKPKQQKKKTTKKRLNSIYEMNAGEQGRNFSFQHHFGNPQKE